MTSADLIALSPLVVVAAAAVLVMLAIAVRRHHASVAAISTVALLLAGASLPAASAEMPRHIAPLLVLDAYAFFFIGLILAAGFAVAILSAGYLHGREGQREEFYLLLLLATLGCLVLVASSHFVSLFLGLELLTVSLYVLIAYPRTDRRPLEAGVKYLILAAASSAFLLFGMALVYAELGVMEFGQMASVLAGGTILDPRLLLAGLAMMVTGIGFKLAVVPFHMWTPDVYEGAPAPVTAFVATASKGAMFALLLRYFIQTGAYAYQPLLVVFSVIALASMLVGNLLALMQDNVKRILAYSSIAHLGYVVVAFLAGGALAVEAVTFYLVAYFVTTLGAFGVVTVLSESHRDADTIADYRGLFWTRPWLAVIFTAMLLSLAGIPLTAGFVGKFYVLAAGIQSALWSLVVVLVVGSAIGLYYYLRIVVSMFTRPAVGVPGPSTPVSAFSLAGGVVLAVLTLVLIWLGVYPAPLMRLIQDTVVRLI